MCDSCEVVKTPFVLAVAAALLLAGNSSTPTEHRYPIASSAVGSGAAGARLGVGVAAADGASVAARGRKKQLSGEVSGGSVAMHPGPRSRATALRASGSSLSVPSRSAPSGHCTRIVEGFVTRRVRNEDS